MGTIIEGTRKDGVDALWDDNLGYRCVETERGKSQIGQRRGERRGLKTVAVGKGVVADELQAFGQRHRLQIGASLESMVKDTVDTCGDGYRGQRIVL